MSERERWRNIRRAPGYQVSDLGHVRTVDRVLADGRLCGGGLRTPTPDRDGYLRVSISGENVRVQHLVLEAFVGPRPYGMEACHDPELATGRDDCRLTVLRWDTHKANIRDRHKPQRNGTPHQLPIGTVPGTPISLRDAVESGLITGTLAAARRALLRDSAGPQPVAATRRSALLYAPLDLLTWEARRRA